MPVSMKKLLLFPLILLLSGCADDTIDESAAKNAEADVAKAKAMGNGYVVNGLHYNMDSVCRYAIVKVNDVKIASMGASMLEKMLSKNKQLEFKTDLQETYAFTLTPELRDSLKYYGFEQKDISTDGGRDIVLTGRSPYNRQGLWEEVSVDTKAVLTRHPVLFDKATSIFMAKENPRVTDVTATNEGGSFTDYSMKVSYNSGSEQYVYFTVASVAGKLAVTVDKFGMK